MQLEKDVAPMIPAIGGNRPSNGKLSPTLCSPALNGSGLTPRSLWAVARKATNPVERISILVEADSENRVSRGAARVNEIVEGDETVYGVNTGFGHFAEIRVPADKLISLQYNIIRSHACSVGEELTRDIVMAMWRKQINCICRGHSGVRRSTIDTIIKALNFGILADIPSRGSVGASGDLSPAAHAVRTLIGEGYCTFPSNGIFHRKPALAALQQFGLAPLELGPKEGLSLINGTSLTTALATKAWYKADVLLRTANLAASLSNVALRGRRSVLDPRLLLAHRHPGTLVCGESMASWLGGHHDDPMHPPLRVQDAYCLRCAPQVHGAVWEEVDHAERILERELNASTDNPLIFLESGDVVSGGNFHAIQPARVSDHLTSALTTLGAISERRISKMMNGNRSGLPTFLIQDGGLQSGFMMAQVTAAALVSECKSLSFPASVDSIPTNCDKEDHVSMGPIAGFKANQVAVHVGHILSIELMAAAQALDFMPDAKIPPRLEKVRRRIRQEVDSLTEDRSLADDFERLARLVDDEALLNL